MEKNQYSPRDYERKTTQNFLGIVLGIVLLGGIGLYMLAPSSEVISDNQPTEETVLAYNDKAEDLPVEDDVKETTVVDKGEPKPKEEPKLKTIKETKPKQPKPKGIDVSQALVLVDEMATPENGFEAYYRYIRNNMVYPSEAIKGGIEGKVTVEFIVDTGGGLHNIKVKRGLGHGCDEAAMLVVKEGGKWKPAKNKGELVMQKITLPISFKLSGDSKPNKN